MAAAAARTIIKEALESLDLDTRLRDTFQGLLDMEESRGHATLHAMQVVSIVDANIKLLRRKSVLEATSLSSQL